MSQVLGIKFNDFGSIYYFSSGPFVLRKGKKVLVKTEQGMGMATVVDVRTSPPEGMEEGDLKPIYRLANEEDEASVAENEELAREARSYCRGCIEKRKLDMKLVDVEVFFDRSKMVFYFTAQGRVDFRELVKDLVRKYRTRIELRQIGVRHETQMLGAVGNCGQVCCCRRFMRRFVPVTIKMAKEQNLFLNPTKISGICGRLLCCLSFEQANYESFHRSCPRLGKKYATTEGRAKPIRSNFFRQSLTVIFESGEEREIPLEEWSEMTSPEALEQAGEQPAAEAAGEPRKERRAKPPRKPSERKPPDKKSRGGGSRKKETEAPEPQAEQPADGQETSGESPAPEQAPAESSAPPAEGDKPKKGRSKKNYRPKRKRKSRSRSAKGPKKDGGQN
jgi:cell fate regulator YaaT (PSP1 superfamily)